jgi:putative zinc finger/helix-turn-helix YgiT family protein
MQSPITGKEMKLKIYDSQLTVRKVAFAVKYHVYVCEDTGTEFESQELVQINLRQAMDQYRSQYKLPFPEELRSIRMQYDVSAAKMSEVLGFGVNQYKQYENGELPSESNANLITMAAQPEVFVKLVKRSDLEEGEKSKLIKKAYELLTQNPEQQRKSWLAEYLMSADGPDIESGFKKPDLERFGMMVSFFGYNLSPFKTVMNKLLFYADFHHFRKHGRSISGAKYRAIEMGPVPNNFDGLFQYAENKGYVTLEHHEFPSGAIGTKFVSNVLPNQFDVLSAEEKNTLEEVLIRFQPVKSQEIIELSHEEEAWIKNSSTRSIISYLDAYHLKAI